jgi:hypothetical protein
LKIRNLCREVRTSRGRAWQRLHAPEIVWPIILTRAPPKWATFEANGYERDASRDAQGAETALALVLGAVREGGTAGAHSFTMLHWRGTRVAALRLSAMPAIAVEGRGLVI